MVAASIHLRLQESLAVAEQRLSRGVEQLATDRQQLPSQAR